ANLHIYVEHWFGEHVRDGGAADVMNLNRHRAKNTPKHLAKSAELIGPARLVFFQEHRPCLQSYLVSVVEPVMTSKLWLRSSKSLAQLCSCTHSPRRMRHVARPICTPYLITASP